MMKQRETATDRREARIKLSKRAAVLLLLVLACGVLSGCYMNPDQVTESNNGLVVGTDGQNFQPVITPTPLPTDTPAPQVTENQQVDWSNWNFGDDAATNPPNNVNPVNPVNPITATEAPQQQGGTNTIGVVKTTPTPKPTGTTTSSTSTALKSGSKGAAVKKLQQKLKDLGYYSGSVDGSYGGGTSSAVKAFQSVNGLQADGVAGKATLDAAYGGNAKKNTGSASGGTTQQKPNTNTNSYTNGKTNIYLRLGDSGAQVKILQNRLIVLGYMSGTADSDFAETTEAGVIAFQKRNNIYSDGIAGPTTLTKLYSSSAKKASSVTANIGSLKSGMNGNGVRALQQHLKSLGFYTGSVDGDFGAGTVTAVTSFQSANGLQADGVAGKATMNAIYAAINGTSGGGGGGSSTTNPEVYGATASSNGYSTISSTSKSNTANVTALQSALSATGFYNGATDGSFGKVTGDAISAYQAAVGLRVTGMAGPSTQRLIYGGMAATGSYAKLKIGSSGTKVKELQYALYELKYYDGSISGKYDEITESAVMTFQQVNGMEMDGVAGEMTQQRLYSSAAQPCNI